MNWGAGLALGMTGFIAFIMFFVITMLSDKKYEHDLVTEDYYGAELHYQQDINAEENAFALPEKVKIERDDKGWMIIFPESQLEGVKGAVQLYRPSNKKLDFTIPLTATEGNSLRVPAEKLLQGRWNINLSWTKDGKEYLVRKELTW